MVLSFISELTIGWWILFFPCNYRDSPVWGGMSIYSIMDVEIVSSYWWGVPHCICFHISIWPWSLEVCPICWPGPGEFVKSILSLEQCNALHLFIEITIMHYVGDLFHTRGSADYIFVATIWVCDFVCTQWGPLLKLGFMLSLGLLGISLCFLRFVCKNYQQQSFLWDSVFWLPLGLLLVGGACLLVSDTLYGGSRHWAR